jgi:hypothetical protein
MSGMSVRVRLNKGEPQTMMRWGIVLVYCLSAWTYGGCRGDSTSSNSDGFEGTNSGISFSPPRGIFDLPLDVTLSHDTASEVRYTLDGSDPRTSGNAITAPLPLTLHLDPANTENRYLAPGVVVRATVGGEDALPGEVATHTYLFVNRVVDLSGDGESPGGDWPEPTSGGEQNGEYGARIDYGIDRDISESEEYADLMESSFRSIPSFSLVTDLANLFDPGIGIYVNATGQGVNWERFASIEILYPDKRAAVQSNAGVRIRGGYSRRPENPKHGFRFFFRGDYGTPKLLYPLFESEGTDEFDKIDLRCAQNYAWSAEDYSAGVSTMNRDVFARDLQRKMGRPYTRSRYYHLYIDGVYWGLFQTQERAEARYAASYFGGDADDYDVVKVATDAGYTIEATDGNLDAWQEVWQRSEIGFTDNASYYELEGKNADGARDASLPVLVDIDNLIDYMLVIFYTANFDGPASKWFQNQNPNNFYAIRSRTDNNHGFVFFAHDNEHTLMADPISITTGVDENRVSIGQLGGAANDSGQIDDSYVMTVTDFSRFHPQWLHQRLSENELYRERFRKRAHALLDGNGLLTEAPASELFQARADEIDQAVIAESARWGDAWSATPRTRNDDWLPAVERVKEGFFGARTPILVSELEEVGLY